MTRPKVGLAFGDLQHHGEALVLLHLGDVGALAVERVVDALDREALVGRGLRRHRRAGDRDHRLHGVLAVVGDAHRRRRGRLAAKLR